MDLDIMHLESQAILCLPFHFPGLPHIQAVFTTRLGGQGKGNFSSANLSFEVGDEETSVQKNRKQLRKQLGIAQLGELKQVHGTKIHFLNTPHLPPYPPEGDALATGQSGLALLVKVADCQPVLIAHKWKKLVAALHVGWRANRSQAIVQWIKAICQHYQVEAQDLLAVRGPSLGPGQAEFVNFTQEWGADFIPYFNPRNQTMNLWDLTREQLKQAGLQEQNIFGLDLCTASCPELFFSYRREQICGRQAGLIWIKH